MECILPEKLKALYPFKSKWLKLSSGYNMHYIGEGQGTPVIMVHGNPTWSFFYRNLVSGLRNSYFCVVPDHIGCGLAQKPRDFDYLLENHIDNLAQLVESLKLESFHLIVHDWGGPIGIGMAQRFPEKLKKIVVLNTAAFYLPKISWRIAVCKNPLLRDFLIRGCNVFVKGATCMAVKKPLNVDVKEGYHFPYNNWDNRIGVANFVKDIPLSLKHRSWNTLKQIDDGLSFLKEKRMLICWGGRDFCFNDYYLKEWVRRFPEAQVKKFPDAGHYILEDAGEEILESVKDFFSSD